MKEAIQKADEDFREHFEKLILNGKVRIATSLETSFVELASTKTLWGLLVNAGYLTVLKDLEEGGLIVAIPNSEVRKEFREIVATYTHVKNDKLNILFAALTAEDMDDFLSQYQKLIYDYISYHDIKENSYHMLLLGMSISVAGLYNITSNLEAGDGRPDIVLESLQPDARPHIVIEIKQGGNLDRLKKEALEQIITNKYYTKLTEKVLCIGLAHNKKECALAHCYT